MRGSGVPPARVVLRGRRPASELAGYFRWSLRDLYSPLWTYILTQAKCYSPLKPPSIRAEAKFGLEYVTNRLSFPRLVRIP